MKYFIIIAMIGINSLRYGGELVPGTEFLLTFIGAALCCIGWDLQSIRNKDR